MARIRRLFVVALSALTLTALAPAAQGRVVFDRVFTGPSVAAMYPSGVEWDAANNRIVVADTGRNRISFYSIGGNRLGGFGSHGSTNGKFDTPRDVAIDGQGRIYVADAANDRVQAFTENGAFRWKTSPSPCSPPPNDPCVNNPIGVTWDSENNVLLVASTGQDRVKAYSANGAYLWESPAPGTIGIDAANGLRDVARHDGMIWIADYGNHRVVAYNVSDDGQTWNTTPLIVLGPATGGAGELPLNFPYNVAFSTDGNTAYVSSTGNSRVAVWDLTGAPTYTGHIGVKCAEPCPNPNPGSPNNQIEDLRRVVVAENDQVITADFWGNGLKVFNPNGPVVRDIEGDSPRPKGLAEAFGVDVGPNGTVYAVDRLNQEVEWYAPNGTFRGTAGSRGTQPDEFSWPEGIAAASDGVWTADSRSGRLQFWSPTLNDSTPTVVDLGVTGYVHDLDVAPNGDVFAAVGGPENRVYRVDGGTHAFEAIGPVFDDPQGVAVGGNFVYVANTGENEIVKLRRSGAFVSRSSMRLHGPQGVAVAPNGKVWVADTRANRVLRLTKGLGLIEAFRPHGRRAFDLPHTLAVSPDGNFLYVADTFNNRIQRYRI